MNHSDSLSVCNENSCNKITCDDNQELVILSNTNTDILRKGLSFIPIPKKLNIYQLHNVLRLFMHRIKCKFELYHKPQRIKNRDSFKIRKRYPYNPERLTDNRTLDTFLHRVRLEIMNVLCTSYKLIQKAIDTPNPDILGELMNLVLKHSVFEFDEKFYLQIQGTAMRTKMAPAYANVFVGILETQLINLASKFIHTWKRFIDDIFIIIIMDRNH